MTITGDLIIRFVERAAERIHAGRDELTELDAMIGDADHGSNLDRGFTAVVERLDELEGHAPGIVLEMVGRTLLATVGGAAGPLYGTAFIRAGEFLGTRDAVTLADIADALERALQGVVERGRVTLGEKTMVDALAPGVAAVRDAADGDATLLDALHRMVDAVEAGMWATVEMEATKGRARYLGARSVGHRDPGAASVYMITLALRDTLEEGDHE